MMTGHVLVLLASAFGSLALPQGGRVVLELAADRAIYHVGEPVELTLTVGNAGERALFGYSQLQPYLPPELKSATLLYCRDGHACRKFLGDIPHIEEKDIAVVPLELPPGRSQISRCVVAWNPAAAALVLDEPGDYEFRWVTWGLHESRGAGPASRGHELTVSAFVRALPVAKGEEEAFASYASRKLADMAQYGAPYARPTEALRTAAHTLFRQHPNSIYAGAIAGGFAEMLEQREKAGQATPEDLERLAELRARASER